MERILKPARESRERLLGGAFVIAVIDKPALHELRTVTLVRFRRNDESLYANTS